MADYLTIPDVEIATVGMKWPTVNGEMTLRFEHLRDAMVAANDDPHVVEPRIKIGHEDARFNGDEVEEKSHDPFEGGDGDPAFGVVRNLRLENDGAVLMGDYTETPSWLAEALPSAYPSRSIEGGFVMKDGYRPAKPEGAWAVETPGGKRYSLVLTAVSLLGIYGPAVLDIEDLRRYVVDGQGLVVAGSPPKGGVIASATIEPMQARSDADSVIEQFVYEFATDEREWWWPRALWTDPNEIIADDDEGGLHRIPFESNDKQEVTFGEPVRVIQHFEDAPATAVAGSLGRGHQERLYARREDVPKGGVTRSATNPSMDAAAELRQVLGLSAESTDDEVTAALAAREGDEETPPAENGGNGDGDESTPAETPDEGEGDETETPDETETAPPAETTPPAASGGIVSIDAETLRDLREKAEQGAAARTEQVKSHRERTLSAAVKAGKFPPSRLDHYRGLFKADPKGTEDLIGGLADGLVPVDERGSSADTGATASAVTEDEMLLLFPGTYRPRSAS